MHKRKQVRFGRFLDIWISAELDIWRQKYRIEWSFEQPSETATSPCSVNCTSTSPINGSDGNTTSSLRSLQDNETVFRPVSSM